MTLMQAFKPRRMGFWKATEGSMPTEGVLAFTFLIWWYISSFEFFDAYKQKNINLKAAYTVADMLSRETGPVASDPNSVPINQSYINGLNTVFDYLTYSNKATWVRVSSIYYDDDNKKYRVDWSATSGSGHPVLTTPTLQAKANQIPVLPTGDSVILVETNMAFEPIFSMGLNAQWFQTFIVTSPRFASCLPWQNNGCGADAAGDWINPDITDIPPPAP